MDVLLKGFIVELDSSERLTASGAVQVHGIISYADFSLSLGPTLRGLCQTRSCRDAFLQVRNNSGRASLYIDLQCYVKRPRTSS
jgi:hypothetical protein